MEYLFRCCKSLRLPSCYGDDSMLDTRGLCVATELSELVDLKLLSLYSDVKDAPQHKVASPGKKMRFFLGRTDKEEDVAPLKPRVEDSISPHVSACVRLAAPLQPLFDILVDQKIISSIGVTSFCRSYIECKWSDTAGEIDKSLNTWMNTRVLPFMSTFTPPSFSFGSVNDSFVMLLVSYMSLSRRDRPHRSPQVCLCVRAHHIREDQTKGVHEMSCCQRRLDNI